EGLAAGYGPWALSYGLRSEFKGLAQSSWLMADNRSSLLRSELLQLRFELLRHVGRHELAHIAAHRRDLPHDSRRYEHVLFTRGQEHRFDIRIHPAVHARELKFVIEV